MGLAEAAAAYEVGTGRTGIGLDLAEFRGVGLGKEVDAEGCLIGVVATVAERAFLLRKPVQRLALCDSANNPQRLALCDWLSAIGPL